MIVTNKYYYHRKRLKSLFSRSSTLTQCCLNGIIESVSCAVLLIDKILKEQNTNWKKMLCLLIFLIA